MQLVNHYRILVVCDRILCPDLFDEIDEIHEQPVNLSVCRIMDRIGIKFRRNDFIQDTFLPIPITHIQEVILNMVLGIFVRFLVFKSHCNQIFLFLISEIRIVSLLTCNSHCHLFFATKFLT